MAAFRHVLEGSPDGQRLQVEQCDSLLRLGLDGDVVDVGGELDALANPGPADGAGSFAVRCFTHGGFPFGWSDYYIIAYLTYFCNTLRLIQYKNTPFGVPLFELLEGLT